MNDRPSVLVNLLTYLFVYHMRVWLLRVWWGGSSSVHDHFSTSPLRYRIWCKACPLRYIVSTSIHLVTNYFGACRSISIHESLYTSVNCKRVSAMSTGFYPPKSKYKIEPISPHFPQNPAKGSGERCELSGFGRSILSWNQGILWYQC